MAPRTLRAESARELVDVLLVDEEDGRELSAEREGIRRLDVDAGLRNLVEELVIVADGVRALRVARNLGLRLLAELREHFLRLLQIGRVEVALRLAGPHLVGPAR